MSELSFETITDDHGLQALEPEWRDLFGRLPGRRYFQSFGHTLRSWEHIARPRGQKLCVVVGRRAGKAVLILPLARHKNGLARMAEWIGGEHSHYQDVLVEDRPEAGAWIDAAWRHVTKTQGVDIMWLNHMNDSSALRPLIHEVQGVGTFVEEAPYIEWSDFSDWPAYYQERSRSLKKELRRRRRRLEEKGKVEFRLLTAREDVVSTLDWMLDHKTGWMERKGLRMQQGGFDTNETQAFHKAFIADACDEGIVHLATLTVDGKIIAADLTLLYEGTLVDYLGAYDHAWDYFAPGKLLQEDLLKWSRERCEIYDFMPYGESYKYLWAPKDAKTTTYLIPCSAWGRIMVAWRRSPASKPVRYLKRLRLGDIPRLVRKRL
ncbi:MAG: GNAT family N-acetyltransferase [Planctomycetota bacterium]|jgi:CelD/BcsL family acetyltransferase involved in cellulose biosynthesis